MSDTQLITAQLFQQGRTSRINGEYDQAVDLLKRAIADDPNFARAHMELGLTYCFTGLFDESIQELLLAAGLEQTDPEIRLHLAKTFTMLGMYDEGKAAFLDVLALSTPGDVFFDEAKKQLAYF